MKAKMKGVIGAMKPTTQNQAAMWSEPDLVGWLEKRGGKFKSWKKRFFVLQGSYLFYFENDFKVQAKNPLGVIPLDGSKVEMKNEDAGDESRRYTFLICLGRQFVGYSKRDTYVIAAPSHQALDEWLQRLKNAAETRESLLDQLQKARWRSGNLRQMLEKSFGNTEMLESAADGPEGQALLGELARVGEETKKFKGEMTRLESQANHEEGALMRAIVVWDILNQYLTGKAQAGKHTSADSRIKMETRVVQQLFRLLQTKGNFLQGQNIENLGKESREKMKAKVHHGMFLVQERQAKIRSKAPRYSFNFNPKIFDDECEALQQEYEQDTEESQPAALKIYKNIQAEVLETAEQLKNIKKAALKVAGIEEKQEDGIDKLISPQDNDDSSNSGIVSNSTMLSDMMKRKADLSATPSVQDTWGHQVEEGTTAWIRGQNQQLPGMQNQSSNQASTSWQQTPVPKVGPPTQVFIPQTPAARLFPESQWSIGRPSPESFVPPQPRQPLAGPPRETFAPRFPGSMPETSTRPMQQAPMAWPPVGQNLVPRGFQQQMGSMPLPPGPPASVIRPPMQMMPSADGSGPPRRVPMSQPMQSSQGFAPFPQAMGCPEAGIFPQALGMSDGGQPSSIQGIGANWPAGFPTQGMMLASRQSALPSSPGQMPGNLPPGMMARNPQTFSPQRMPGNLRPGMMAPNPQTLSPQRMPGNLPPGTIAPTPQTFPPQQVNPGIRPTMPMRPQVQTAPMQQTFARPFTGAQPPTALPQQNFARPPFVNTQCRPA